LQTTRRSGAVGRPPWSATLGGWLTLPCPGHRDMGTADALRQLKDHIKVPSGVQGVCVGGCVCGGKAASVANPCGLQKDFLVISCDLITDVPLYLLADIHRKRNASVRRLRGSLSLSVTLSLSHTLTHTHTLSLSHTHTLSHSLSHTLTLALSATRRQCFVWLLRSRFCWPRVPLGATAPASCRRRPFAEGWVHPSPAPSAARKRSVAPTRSAKRATRT
jgi:hypothetical protein